MSVQNLVELALAALAWTVISVAFGATLMWRLVHVPKLPPALPVWVSTLYLTAGLLMAAAMLVSEAWLGLAGAVFTSLAFAAQLMASLRNRASERH